MTEHFSENPEQTQESSEISQVVSPESLNNIRNLVDPLLGALEKLPDGDLIGEIIENSLKMLRDQTNRGDVKLINKAFKEIRYALKVFAPYREVRKVSIFGSARTPVDDPDYTQCAEFARKIAERGWMVITGAGGGIMAAGHDGAGPDPSFGLAIRLPFEQKTNRTIADDPKLINFKYFFTRKLMFVRSSNAVALFPGGFGTWDEGFEVLTLIQTGKSVPTPVVFVDHKGGDYWKSWLYPAIDTLLKRRFINDEDISLFTITDDIDEAVHVVTRFYHNYHSVRTLKDELAIRIHRAPNEEQLARINREFAIICMNGGFRVAGPHPLESDEPSLANMPRLVFKFNKRDHAHLRRLIDVINGF